MTVTELNHRLVSMMSPALGADEAKAAARIMWEDTLHYTPAMIITRGDHQLEQFTVDRLVEIAQKVVNGQPVQYAVGMARFMGLDLDVNNSTLIPRPETAGLVDIIVDFAANRSDLRVIDIGTGSGCIAIALSRALRFAHVSAIDISDEALKVAKANAQRLNADVTFNRADALSLTNTVTGNYDIVVSNPPYVLESEKASMDRRVVDYEPAAALFVPDNDPLKFYKPIAQFARKALIVGGGLFFEINPLMADRIRELLVDEGFGDVSIQRDYRGVNRYAIAICR